MSAILSLCLYQIWIHLFGLFTLAKMPDNNKWKHFHTYLLCSKVKVYLKNDDQRNVGFCIYSCQYIINKLAAAISSIFWIHFRIRLLQNSCTDSETNKIVLEILQQSPEQSFLYCTENCCDSGDVSKIWKLTSKVTAGHSKKSFSKSKHRATVLYMQMTQECALFKCPKCLETFV